MDNIVLWVALIGVIGTLGGVCLGNWLQSRNIRQQREWMLQDQKREWIRRQKREEFERISKCVQDTLEFVLKAEWILQFGSKELQEQMFLKYRDQTASAMPIIYTIMRADKELTELLSKFAQNCKEVTNTLLARDYSKLDVIGQQISEIAGQIQQRINELLEETFD